MKKIMAHTKQFDSDGRRLLLAMAAANNNLSLIIFFKSMEPFARELRKKTVQFLNEEILDIMHKWTLLGNDDVEYTTPSTWIGK